MKKVWIASLSLLCLTPFLVLGDRPPVAVEESALNSFYAQFDADQFFSRDVTASIESQGFTDPVLFAGRLEARDIFIGWDSAAEDLMVGVDGAMLADLIVDWSNPARPIWSGDFAKVTSAGRRERATLVPQLYGFAVAEENGNLVLGVNVRGVSYRIIVTPVIQPDGGVSATLEDPLCIDCYAVVEGAACRCFGFGTPGSCTDKDCSEGAKCTPSSPKKSCRWSPTM